MDDQFNGIEIRDLTVTYQDMVIFDRLSLTLPAKGCVCFFGPSGSGKTTLLSVIAGLKKPSSGMVGVKRDGDEREENSGKGRSLSEIAYVFQENRLIPWLTALENISFVIPKKGTGGKTPDPTATAREWLTRLGLRDSMDKYPGELSGGMRQRVNIARALAYNAPVLLLDEPFKGLDDALKDRIISILNEQKKHRLLLLVTHDKEDVQRLADQVIPIGKPDGKSLPIL